MNLLDRIRAEREAAGGTPEPTPAAPRATLSDRLGLTDRAIPASEILSEAPRFGRPPVGFSSDLTRIAAGGGGAVAGTICNSGRAAGSATQQDAEAGMLVAHALTANGFDASEDGTGRGTPLVPGAFNPTQITSKTNRSNPQAGDPCHTLAKVQHAPAIAFHTTQDPISGDVSPALGTGSKAGTGSIGALAGASVRRLTPRECERLQGFPDDWTLVPWRKGLAPDGPRYKACGNSMAVPVMRWIGTRIAEVDAYARDTEAA